MKNEYLLQIKDISKSFSGVRVLKDVSLNVRPGTVHSLMGENGAGKSTLMKCLFGIYRQDAGQFFLEGQEFNFTDAKDALENGVSMVHQELNQVVQRSIVDNIWLGRYPNTLGYVNSKKMVADTIKLFERLNVDIDPHKKLSELSVSHRQMVEIAKAVSYDAKVIVLDEPTSSLTENEVDKLFEIIRTLKKEGCGIIYISHKMDEIYAISDDITVLRDGTYIDTKPIDDISMDGIIKMMVGRDLNDRFPPKDNVPSEVHIAVKKMNSLYPLKIKDIDFDLRKGEILGVYGLVGAGRTELLEALFGLRTLTSGEIYKDGKKIDNSSPEKAIENGFALVTEERRVTGIFEMANIRANTVVANLKAYENLFKVLDSNRMKEDTATQIKNLKTKTHSQESLIYELSGGNQQKVILGRWLLRDPDVLLLDEPTRGIDVGAKYEIYQLIINLAKLGKSVIVVSSEMPELLGITDRLMVMSNGHIAGTVNTDSIDQNEVLKMATSYL